MLLLQTLTNVPKHRIYAEMVIVLTCRLCTDVTALKATQDNIAI